MVGHAYHMGTLKAIQDMTGWDPRTADVIVGTSAGSSVASLLRATDLTVDDGYEIMLGHAPRHFARLLKRFDMPMAQMLGEALGFPRLPSLSLVKSILTHNSDAPISSLFASMAPAGPIPKDLLERSHSELFNTHRWPTAPTWINACRLDIGKRITFGYQVLPGAPASKEARKYQSRPTAPTTPCSLSTAVAASCAIPGVFTPVEHDGIEYVDGGIISHTNLDLLAGQGLDLALVLAPMSTTSSVRGLMDIPAAVFFRNQLANEANVVRRLGTPVAAFEPSRSVYKVMGFNAMDPHRRGEVAFMARRDATERLEQGEFGKFVTKLLTGLTGKPRKQKTQNKEIQRNSECSVSLA